MMPENKKGKHYRQKNDQKKARQYGEEIAEELSQDKQNLWQTTTKTEQKSDQYQREVAQDFLTDQGRFRATVPGLDEETSEEFAAERRMNKKQKKNK
jgi:hypothetical protein